MRVEVNGQPEETGAVTLAELIDARGQGGAALATAVNGEFVPKALRAARRLAEGDRIEILAPMQGG